MSSISSGDTGSVDKELIEAGQHHSREELTVREDAVGMRRSNVRAYVSLSGVRSQRAAEMAASAGILSGRGWPRVISSAARRCRCRHLSAGPSPPRLRRPQRPPPPQPATRWGPQPPPPSPRQYSLRPLPPLPPPLSARRLRGNLNRRGATGLLWNMTASNHAAIMYPQPQQ
ncbi:serine/arginine repetitive matrix protein 1-like [Schistocerca nitens]|uniref:serine/arginine repetitive matrix protein 1-like n=1 Tax=Schistocerca nitens TaxID=7011 RepID=UPI002117EA0F|nr:serine/arginine repetitive matrix protein 1-like [Schistocerca nitens]